MNFRNRISFEFLFYVCFSYLYIVNFLWKSFEHIFLFFWRHEIKWNLGWRSFKTSYDEIMLILSRRTSSRLSYYKNSLLPLTVSNVHLEKSFCVKYLGVYMDCHLTWHDHIVYICDKISKNINIMVKLKHYASKATLTSVYYSLIYPYLQVMLVHFKEIIIELHCLKS